MHRFLIAILIVLTAALVLPGCGGGGNPTPTGDLSGTVMTVGVVNPESGSYALDVPVVGATVAVEGTSLTATTNVDGAFAISGLGSGSYYLVITKQGYQQSRQQVTAPRSSLTFRLNKDTGTMPDLPAF